MRQILDNPEFDPLTALEHHRGMLHRRMERSTRLLNTIDRTLNRLTEDDMTLTDEELYEGFTTEQIERYKREAREIYDPASTASRVKKILGYEYEGAYMVLGFDGDPDIAALQEQKGLEICLGLGGQDLGREPGEAWWEHRYDFYYPPQNLKLPWMYGTTETITTYDKIEPLYYAIKNAVESGFPEWDIRWIGHFSHWFHWGVMLYSRFIIENPPEDAEEALRLHNRVWKAAMQAVLDNDGMINEHHGVGLKLARYMRDQFGPSWPFVLRLKKTIDPNGIMNPGKVGFGF